MSKVSLIITSQITSHPRVFEDARTRLNPTHQPIFNSHGEGQHSVPLCDCGHPFFLFTIVIHALHIPDTWKRHCFPEGWSSSLWSLMHLRLWLTGLYEAHGKHHGGPGMRARPQSRTSTGMICYRSVFWDKKSCAPTPFPNHRYVTNSCLCLHEISKGCGIHDHFLACLSHRRTGILQATFIGGVVSFTHGHLLLKQ